MSDDTDARLWDRTAERNRDGDFFMDPLLAAHYQRVHLALCRAWAPDTSNPRVLKTDVFAEATCPERAFAWSIGSSEQLVSVDISSRLLCMAQENAKTVETGGTFYAVGDVRALPFANSAFDLVVSDSTLDHFHEESDIARGIQELARVLRPGGVLIITMDNPTNLTDPLFKAWMALGKNPFFIGKTFTARRLRNTMREAGFDVTATTAIIHNPRYFAKAGIRLLRHLHPPGYEGVVRQFLEAGDSLGRSPTRLLTAQFIAARGVKSVHSEQLGFND